MNPAQFETLRHAVLESLAARSGVALPVRGIRRRLATEVDFPVEEADVNGALLFLQDKGLVTSDLDPLGSTLWWRATADGILAVERSPS